MNVLANVQRSKLTGSKGALIKNIKKFCYQIYGSLKLEIQVEENTRKKNRPMDQNMGSNYYESGGGTRTSDEEKAQGKYQRETAPAGGNKRGE